jgi:ATP-binding cassette subfamily B multidrug efflux pump
MIDPRASKSGFYSGSRQPGRPMGGIGGHGPHQMPGPISKPKDARKTVKQLWVYLKDHRGTLLFIFISVLLSSILNLVGPYFIGKAIDDYIIPGDFNGLMRMALMLISIYILVSLFTYIQNRLMIQVAQKTVFHLREDLFSRLQYLPIKYFDQHLHGDLMSRLTNDIDLISNALSSSIVQVFTSIITLIGTVIMMLWLSPLLTAVSLTVIPLVFLFTRMIASRTRESFLRQQSQLGDLNGLIEENISGQKVVKIFNREKQEIEEFEKQNTALKGIAIRAQIYSGILPPLMNLLNNFGFAVVAGVGGYMAIRQIITIGVIASFITYSRHFARPLNELANQFNIIQSGLSSAERVFDVMNEPPETADSPDVAETWDIRGEVEFREVSFSYKPEEPVLKNISFHIFPGQTVAIVGPTGAGKTTIVNLLTRFYDVESGKIFIDGIDIRDIKRSALRSLLGIVLQDTYLFAESVRDNIRYGRLDASDQEIQDVARLANAEQFIRHLPNGYDTILTEDGSDLSQGQRQLIAISRVLLANPSILILDEATSSIDTRTEKYVQKAMLNLMKGRTSLVIAHRLSTIRNADLILVINQGEIVEQGNHQQLLDKKGFYYNLYMSQFNSKSIQTLEV